MKKILPLLLISFSFFISDVNAQEKETTTIAAIIKEASENSQLKHLGHELLDGIGPRLVGSPKMQQANDWAVAKYASFFIGWCPHQPKFAIMPMVGEDTNH